jgi:hypothetical protein
MRPQVIKVLLGIARRSEIAACRNSGDFRQGTRTRTPSSLDPQCRTVVNILLTNFERFCVFFVAMFASLS